MLYHLKIVYKNRIVDNLIYENYEEFRKRITKEKLNPCVRKLVIQNSWKVKRPSIKFEGFVPRLIVKEKVKFSKPHQIK